MEWMNRLGIGCFAANRSKRELKTENDSGGEDLFDAAVMESAEKPDHLAVMVNGIIGSSADWKYAAEQFVKKFPDKVLVHRSESNSATMTFDGVDMMGERLANEVLSVIKNRSGLKKISFVAHSLGGLVARYAIGKLYEQPSEANSLDSPSKARSGEIAGSRFSVAFRFLKEQHPKLHTWLLGGPENTCFWWITMMGSFHFLSGWPQILITSNSYRL